MLAKLRPGGHVEYYTCPMTDDCPAPHHNLVRLDHPGKCPICGMTLVPVMSTSPVTNSTTETQP